MMSKKQWVVLLCMDITYIFLGATFFYHVQSEDEFGKRLVNSNYRVKIEDLLTNNYKPTNTSSLEDIFTNLSDYCGKPMRANVDVPIIWDFFHSLFFVITVVTTVGYGNIAPTTMFGRIFMIFYALIGIPLNGMVMVTLGEYFAKSFRKLYQRWKHTKAHYHASRLGLIGQVILYLIPGFTFFIFIPSVIIMVFEKWDYDVAVYYCFVTLTTIGFGDYVPTYSTQFYDFNQVAFTTYRVFLLIWVMIGLGYGVMIIGFISTGLRSKRMHRLERALAQSIKQTPTRIRALRSLVHEILLLRVKPVYKQPFIYTPTFRERSQSCPDLVLDRNLDSPTMVRKRAFSAVEVPGPEPALIRVSSDSDLARIDMERTFQPEQNQQNELLRRVANALGNYESMQTGGRARGTSMAGIDGFSDDEILASEAWSMENNLQSPRQPSPYSVTPKSRKRACSEVKFPFGLNDDQDNNDLTWYGTSATKKLQEMRQLSQQQAAKRNRSRSQTLPSSDESIPTSGSRSLFNRLLKSFNREDKIVNVDIEKQKQAPSPVFRPKRNRAFSVAPDIYLSRTQRGRPSTHSVRDDPILEDKIAELLLTLTSSLVTGEDSSAPKRKLGTASLTPPSDVSPPLTRRPIRQPLVPLAPRRSSLMPTPSASGLLMGGLAHPSDRRRLSLMPDGQRLLAPPPYSPIPMHLRNVRKSSLRPTLTSPLAASPTASRRHVTATAVTPSGSRTKVVIREQVDENS